MRTRIDVAAAGQTVEARALLDRLDDSEVISLGVPSGAGDLIRDQPPGRGVEALIFPACYQLSAELGILLDARTCPARIIATHHESRTPAITYFQLRGAGAIVEEIPGASWRVGR